MSDITRQQLQELTAAINDSFNEFERDGVPVFRTLMPGQVRLILAEIEGWQAHHNPTGDAVADAYWRGHADGAMVARGQVAHAAEQEVVKSSSGGEIVKEVVTFGPTGAELARTGSVRLNGDGTASFALGGDGEQVHFRITLDDDESNADRYYRGFNDGVAFVTSGEAEAVKDPAYWGEKEEHKEETDPPHGFYPGTTTPLPTGAPEPDSIDDATAITDDDRCGEDDASKEYDQGDPDDYDPELDFGSDDPTAPITPLSREIYGTPMSAEFVQLRDDNRRAVDELALKQSAAAVGQMILPPVAPLIPRRPHMTPDEEAEQIAAKEGQRRHNLKTELSAIIDALNAMAVDREMPAILAWDSDKPEALPRWEAIQRRHDIASWSAMAKMADLEYGQYRERITERKLEERNKPGPKPGSSKMPTLDEVCAELVRQSVGTGVMPSINTFDAARPANWIKAWGIVRRLNMSWNELADVAGLKPRPHGRPLPEAASA